MSKIIKWVIAIIVIIIVVAGVWYYSAKTTTAPLISQVGQAEGTTKYGYYISGERLAGAEVYINGSLITETRETESSSVFGNQILFNANLSSGSYPLYVQSSAGKSNIVNLVIPKNI